MAKDGPDPDILRRAVQKVVAKESLTLEEQAAFKAHEKRREEETRWKYYETIPAKHWKAMSGRQTKVINEQAVRHGIPFGGASVNLPKVVRALHDFLALNKIKLQRDEDALLTGPNSPALERYREERALMARMNRLEREGRLLDRDLVKQSLSTVADIIRQCGESLQKQHGEGALQILLEAIDDAEAEVERFFAGPVQPEEALDGTD